jgi:uncharacterized protein
LFTEINHETKSSKITGANFGDKLMLSMHVQRNVLGGALQGCSTNPMTGYFRNGCCDTDSSDLGSHTVCALVSEEFLNFSRSVGNDLSTPRGSFLGLKNGDCWCLCAGRWLQAEKEGFAPKVFLESTNIAALSIVSLELLKKYNANSKSSI